jgi:hypothetical protein
MYIRVVVGSGVVVVRVAGGERGNIYDASDLSESLLI